LVGAVALFAEGVGEKAFHPHTIEVQEVLLGGDFGHFIPKAESLCHGSTPMTRIRNGTPGRIAPRPIPSFALSVIIRVNPWQKNQRAYTSVDGKKYAISTAAVSGASEPCTALASIESAKSARMVPAPASFG